MDKKDSFEDKIDLLKKEVQEIRDFIFKEYNNRLRTSNDNGLIYLKRNRDKITKVANCLFSIKPLPSNTREESKKNINFGKILKGILENIVLLSDFLEKEIAVENTEKYLRDPNIYLSNLDNLRLALKYLKTLDTRKDLFERNNDE